MIIEIQRRLIFLTSFLKKNSKKIANSIITLKIKVTKIEDRLGLEIKSKKFIQNKNSGALNEFM